MIRVYAIENYKNQLVNNVTYKEADKSEIVHKINTHGGKYSLYDNCYKLNTLRIYIESHDGIWDPNEKDYEEYPIEQFIKDARKNVTKINYK